MLQIEKVSKTYHSKGIDYPVLRDVTAAIHDGEFVAIMRPSGSGKTTLLNVISGFIRADGGKVILDGQDILTGEENEIAEIRQHKLGFVFQDFMLLNGLTIREISGAPLFDRLSGTVKNLKVTDVTVERWKSDQGANALAKSLQNAKVSRLQLKNILLAGGDNTGALAGTAQNTTISEVWAEGLNINPYGPAFAGKTDLMVGGLIAQLNGGVHVNDSYAAGEITVRSNTQGGVFGYNNYGTENTVKQVVSNMRTKSTSPQTD